MEDPVLAHRVFVTTDIQGAATNDLLQDDDHEDDFKDMDWIVAGTENGIPTEKQKMRSCAVEDLEKMLGCCRGGDLSDGQ